MIVSQRHLIRIHKLRGTIGTVQVLPYLPERSVRVAKFARVLLTELKAVAFSNGKLTFLSEEKGEFIIVDTTVEKILQV